MGAPEVDDDISIFGNVGLELTNDSQFYMFGNYSERDVRGGFITVTAYSPWCILK